MPIFGKRDRHLKRPIVDVDVARVEAFVTDAWPAIAASAWKGYKAMGRGFLYLDFEADETIYVPAAMPDFADSNDPRWDDVKRKARAYNPKKELVLVLNHFVSESMTVLQPFTPQGMPSPPQAFEQGLDSLDKHQREN